MKTLDNSYWNQRYLDQTHRWDIGYASPQLINIANQYDLNTRILIPGAGNAYEVETLYKQGFHNVDLLDFAEWPITEFKRRNPQFPENQVIMVDFFNHFGAYDLILEQTFFCALNPNLRPAYAQKMHELLSPQGYLGGLLFDFPLTEEGPPFGGTKEAYLATFEPWFEVIEFEISTLSIPQRLGKEFYFLVRKKS